ncbi:MAG: VCBS repeat-containing protein [Verrucomicrobiales bacterium]
MPAAATGVTFQLDWSHARENIREFTLLNPSGGICTGDYDGDDKPDFYVTSPHGGGRLYRNLGGFRFEDATEAAGVSDPDHWGSGCAFADVDNDGDLDLFVCGYAQPDRLWINDGAGKFADRAKEFGCAYAGGSMEMAFADYDADGWLDGYLATTAVVPPPGVKFAVRFVKQADGTEKPVVPRELAEYWELLYLPGDRATRVEAGQFDHLYRGAGGGKFAESTGQAGIDGAYFTLSAKWWDPDEDGLPDLYVSNDYTGPDAFYKNLGGGKLRDAVNDAMPHTPWFSMGADSGDLDGDGRIDFLASDMAATTHYWEKVTMGNMDDMGWFLEWAQPRQYMRNALYLNSGTDRFHEAAFMAGLASTDWTWSIRVADFDSDGFNDVFVTNGVARDLMNSDLTEMAGRQFKPLSKEYIDFWLAQPMRKEANLAFHNDGGLKFKRADDWGLGREGVSYGAATADFDGDGDLDLVVSNADAPVSVYRNRSAGSNLIAVRLTGTRSNRMGIGATVKATAVIGGERRTVAQQAMLSRGFLSASDPLLHFGLGDAPSAEALEIRWPSGQTQRFENLEANQLYTITEPAAAPPGVEKAPPALPSAWFAESGALAEARHIESDFNDFIEQPLLPNRMSQFGPPMAWADIDGDGDADAFIGGAAGQAGSLWRSGGDGSFAKVENADLDADKPAEDTGALFFDADGDGDPDLYVASGGVEESAGGALYRDRLYLNGGSGDFTRAADALPDLRDSSAALCAADIDGDGDLDLFAGSRSVPHQYPAPPQSRLLRNEGGGKFAEVASPAADAGLVTAALWADADADGDPDLITAAEWGGVRLWKNAGGTLTEQPNAFALASGEPALGWWNGLAAADVDGDGDLDFAATNFGLNTKYKADPAHPAFLYYGDLDGSGKMNVVEAKLGKDGKLLPRRGFSCSREAMPSLNDKMKTFHNFASATLGEIYQPDRLEHALRVEANTLESGIFFNEGGRFVFKPLPRLAQIAPSFGAVLHDLDADGDPDLALAQNFFGPQRETGHMDGGLSLVLQNDGNGNFAPVPPAESGIVVPEDAMALAAPDVNGDGKPDLVFSINNGAPKVYLRR